jgi:hypothetical protein
MNSTNFLSILNMIRLTNPVIFLRSAASLFSFRVHCCNKVSRQQHVIWLLESETMAVMRHSSLNMLQPQRSKRFVQRVITQSKSNTACV